MINCFLYNHHVKFKTHTKTRATHSSCSNRANNNRPRPNHNESAAYVGTRNLLKHVVLCVVSCQFFDNTKRQPDYTMVSSHAKDARASSNEPSPTNASIAVFKAMRAVRCPVKIVIVVNFVA